MWLTQKRRERFARKGRFPGKFTNGASCEFNPDNVRLRGNSGHRNSTMSCLLMTHPGSHAMSELSPKCAQERTSTGHSIGSSAATFIRRNHFFLSRALSPLLVMQYAFFQPRHEGRDWMSARSTTSKTPPFAANKPVCFQLKDRTDKALRHRNLMTNQNATQCSSVFR